VPLEKVGDQRGETVDPTGEAVDAAREAGQGVDAAVEARAQTSILAPR
jgi:hypothetical protein